MSEGIPEVKKSYQEPKDEQASEMQLGMAIDRERNQLNKIGKELTEVIPQGRNFDIEINESKSGVHFKLKHRTNGSEKDLDTFLPKGNCFAKDTEFVFHRDEGKVGYNPDEIQFRGFLIALFHEIGHAHEKEDHIPTTWDSLKAAWHAIGKWRKIMAKAREKDTTLFSIGKGPYVSFVESLPRDYYLPQWYLDKMGQAKSRSERGAWAFALNSLRKLEQDGYNVFAGFENAAQLRAYVAYCLYTYDVDLFKKKALAGDFREVQKTEETPAFLKGSKLYEQLAPRSPSP